MVSLLDMVCALELSVSDFEVDESHTSSVSKKRGYNGTLAASPVDVGAKLNAQFKQFLNAQGIELHLRQKEHHSKESRRGLVHSRLDCRTRKTRRGATKPCEVLNESDRDFDAKHSWDPRERHHQRAGGSHWNK